MFACNLGRLANNTDGMGCGGNISKQIWPTLQHETTRRKAENTARELWFFISSKLKELKEATVGSTAGKILQEMESSLIEYRM